ncbi:hypothetical protein SELMODRAFT_407946 [Selaginella moellendorffii]|uniref:Uncharacterized protein n=1 Tax=Selaginella moellendorffii TaxID=88036 RepID=D8R5A5_SELML|nr:hypothetical protein SELMODRAFT_407946 [Selaginella moellendorffii]
MPSKFVLLDVFLQEEIKQSMVSYLLAQSKEQKECRGDQKKKKQSHFHHVIEKWNPNVAPKPEHMKAELKTVQSAAIDVVSWSGPVSVQRTNPWNVVPLVKAFGFRTFEMDKEVVVRYLLAAISAHKLLQAFQRVEELDRLLSFHNPLERRSGKRRRSPSPCSLQNLSAILPKGLVQDSVRPKADGYGAKLFNRLSELNVIDHREQQNLQNLWGKWGLEVSEEKISLKTLEETLEETLEFVRKQGDSMVNMDLMDAFEGYMSVLARNFFLCGLEPIRGHKIVVTATVGYLNEEEPKEFVAVHKRLVRQPGGAWSGGVGMTFTHITGGAFCCWSLSGRGVGSEPGEVCKIWEEEKQQCMETALNSVAHTLSGLHFGYHLDDLGRTSWKP